VGKPGFLTFPTVEIRSKNIRRKLLSRPPVYKLRIIQPGLTLTIVQRLIYFSNRLYIPPPWKTEEMAELY
jgi:hypothetical protein